MFAKSLARSLILLLLTGASAAAETWPVRPITMIVPFPAGGPTDVLGRIVAERLNPALRQSVVVENVSGAGGTIALARVARAEADGYTVIVGNITTQVFSGAVYSTSYDLVEDFEPVILLSTAPSWLIARNNLPASNVRELVDWLRASAQKPLFATIGPGSPPHVWALLFQEKTDTRFQLVPYRGGAPIYQDLMAGRVDLTELEASSTLPYVQSGKIRAYAVLGKTRWAAAPDVPTIEEAGLPGLELPYWTGLWVRKGTPRDVIIRLNAAVAEAMVDPGLRRRLTEMGQEIPTREQQTPQALDTLQRAAIAKWWPITRAANIRAE